MTGSPDPSRTVLIAATHNRDKLRPLADIIGGRFQLLPLPDGVVVDEPDVDRNPGGLTDPGHRAADRPPAPPGPDRAAQRAGRPPRGTSKSTSGTAGRADGHPLDPLVMIAAAKARSASVGLPGRLVIASDGGLLVPALGAAWTPARTRRFAGPDATNAERVAALLDLTAGLRRDDRRIGWREAVAVARDGRLLLTAAAESAPGWLATVPPPDLPSPQGFWLPALWRSWPGPGAGSGIADGHWVRLAALVGPALGGMATPRTSAGRSRETHPERP